MKFLALLPILVFIFFPTTPITVKAETEHFARIVSSNTKLYRSTSGEEGFSNTYFILPETYFVKIEQSDSEEYYTATYIDVTGFVKKSEVQCVSGTPTNKYASNASFRVFIPSGVDLRSSPTQSEGLNALDTVQFLETNLQYYGKINGEEAISYRSTEWFYCKYTKNGTSQKGYLYNAFCDLLTNIPANTEVLEYIDEPEFEIVPTSGEKAEGTDTSISSLPSATQIIIIVAVCLPCIFIIYLLFRPTKITARAMEKADLDTKKKTKNTKTRYKDYYEYDE